MAQEKDFVEIRTRYYLEKPDGSTVDLPPEMFGVEQVSQNLGWRRYYFPYCTFKVKRYLNEGKEDAHNTYLGKCCGLIDTDGNIIIEADYDHISVVPFETDEVAEHYLFLQKDDTCGLWSIERKCMLLGGKFFYNIHADEVVAGLVPVATRKEASTFGDTKVWRLADIETGEVLPYKYSRIDRENDRFFVWGGYPYLGLFDAQDRRPLCPCRAKDYDFSADFILVEYTSSAKIINYLGTTIVDELSTDAEVESGNWPNLFSDGDRYYNLFALESADCVAVAEYQLDPNKSFRASSLSGIKLEFVNERGEQLSGKQFLKIAQEIKQEIREKLLSST